MPMRWRVDYLLPRDVLIIITLDVYDVSDNYIVHGYCQIIAIADISPCYAHPITPLFRYAKMLIFRRCRLIDAYFHIIAAAIRDYHISFHG